MTAAATRRYRPVIEAMNANRLPRFADGVVDAALAQQKARIAAPPHMAASASAAGIMPVTINNPGEPMTGTAERKADGSLEITLNRLESRAAGNAASGRGA